MAMISQFFQPPLYWQQFEELATGMLREVYDSPAAQGYGRPGQAQNGVDVYGKSRYGMIGIQCKRLADRDHNNNPYPGGTITREFLRKAAKESLSFSPKLAIWILATTARRDTRVQKYVDDLNEEWARGNHGIIAMVWSWDECVSALNCYPNLQKWYYRDVIQISGAKAIDEIILSTIGMAFARPAFELPLHSETPEEFMQALKDTQQALRTGELVDRVSRHVIRKAVGGYREINDALAREELRKIDYMLRKLRTKIQSGLACNAISRVNDLLIFSDLALADELETIRWQCISDLNKILLRYDVPLL